MGGSPRRTGLEALPLAWERTANRVGRLVCREQRHRKQAMRASRPSPSAVVDTR